MKRKYHGWVVLEDGGPGMSHVVFVEYFEKPSDEQRRRFRMGYGNSGCASAVEFFDKRVGETVKLESYGAMGYRVYTEEIEV